MILEIERAKDEKQFENKVAKLKATLMQEYINKLSVDEKMKKKISKEIIKKLENI